ncbi:VC0807 family protein [Kitasatospora sp. NPDC051984]|uniref:VC0807 family protein n=1 Tax=Kitasatospora sp. NPDC051984 TaxID=3364059 RepID=UPI0037C69806
MNERRPESVGQDVTGVGMTVAGTTGAGMAGTGSAGTGLAGAGVEAGAGAADGGAADGGAAGVGAVGGGAAELPRTADGQVDWAALAGDDSTPQQRAARGWRQAAKALVFELAIPLGGYYTLLGLGAGQWLAITLSSLAALPWLLYGLVRNRRLDPMPVFTLLLIAVSTLLSAVTGSPRVLMVRDSWVFGVIGVWVLGSLLTRRPFMYGAARAVVAAKIGPAGADAWIGQWDYDPAFRRHLRLLTVMWGTGFALDALIRVGFALTLPLGAVPLVNALQWLVVLGGMIGFHTWYVKRNGLLV